MLRGYVGVPLESWKKLGPFTYHTTVSNITWLVPLPRMLARHHQDGSQPKPSSATVTGRGDNPSNILSSSNYTV